ncbi:unnamed protein product [Alopecurus aequalis]
MLVLSLCNGSSANETGSSPTSSTEKNVFSLDNYGAHGDGKHDDTQALSKAWNAACSSSRPAQLLIPKGKSYLLKSTTLSGPCKSTVVFMVKGTLVAPLSRSDWSEDNISHWIMFQEISDLTVTGGGAINVVCGPGHGISIGSLGDDNSRAEVSGITIDSVQLYGTTNGARIKTWQGGSGYAKDIIFQNIIMDNVQNPIIIDQNYCDSAKPCENQESAVEISNSVFKNIRGTTTSKDAIKLSCSKNAPCSDISLENIELKLDGGKGDTESTCQNAKWRKSGNVVPLPCKGNN